MRWFKLRYKLFASYSLLSVAILLAAAWVIDTQVVVQARQQIQEEMKISLPLYDAVWEEQAGRLSALGMAMAGSPIVKTIFGDPRAARDAETIRQMLAEFGPPLAENVDVVMVSDGGGNVIFSESRDPALPRVSHLPPARIVALTQKPAGSFELLDGRLFRLAFSPVVSHSGSAEFNATLVVLVAGSELNQRMARELKRRARSDVLFFGADRLRASSLDPETEARAGEDIAAIRAGRREADDPAEITVGGESHLAFVRPLASLDGKAVGHVVVLRSLERASRLFRAISNRLVLVGTISVLLVSAVSYVIARRITQPLEALADEAREIGQGNYDRRIGLPPEGEIGQVATAFEQMRQSVKQGRIELLRHERLVTIGQMASGIIHDLRNPLAAISTAAEVFSGTELPADQRRALAENQLRASQRMESMLRELLDFSRGTYRLQLGRHELAPLVISLLRELNMPDAAPAVTVRVEVPPGIFVRVDVDRIRRLFDNLLANSLQAMPGVGAITIRAAAVGRTARVNFADTGAGIPAQLRDRLFEPFASHGKEGGSGLGLAIARGIAEAHGGTLTLASEVDQPADFCLELPLAPEDSHAGRDSGR